MKNILILTGSPRVGGNSDLMADAFQKGAESTGHKVIRYEAGRNAILPCRACESCFSNGKACVWDDRFSNELAPLIEEADVMVYVPGPAESRDRQDVFLHHRRA